MSYYAPTCFLFFCVIVSPSLVALADSPVVKKQELASRLAELGIAKILDGVEWEKGQQLLKSAIKGNLQGCGSSYEVRLSVSDANREWGESQLKLMLADRPAMKSYLIPDSELWNWMAAGFGGSLVNARIKWDPTLPKYGTAANQGPWGNNLGRVMVHNQYTTRDGTTELLSPETSVVGICFEMHNMANWNAFLALVELARRNAISKKDFVKEACVLEVRAAQQTRALYVDTVLPYAFKHGIDTNPMDWFCD